MNPFELLAALRQDFQLVDTYIEQFEMALAQIGHLPPDQSMAFFINGLRDEVKW